MIDLYTWATPNGHKLHIMLEETGLEYIAHPVDIGAGDQFEPAFLAVSPNNKIPAMIDRDGPGGEPLAMFESGAMLIYLAEKTDRFLPQETRARMSVLQWLMFQVASVGPMLGQAHHFIKYAPETFSYPVARYRNEANRLYGVMDRRLEESPYLAGQEYTIADIATFPWLRSPANHGVDVNEYPNVRRWFETVNERPAVQRGLQVLKDFRTGPMTEQARDILFGKVQYRRR